MSGRLSFLDSRALPLSWKLTRFTECVFFQEGPGIRNWQYVEGDGVPFVNIRCLEDGRLVRQAMSQISKAEAFGKYSHFLLNEGDYVVSSSGTLGRIATVRKEDLPCCLNTSVIRMRSSSDTLDHGFLKYFLLSDFYGSQIRSFANGSAQLNYGPTHLAQMEIVVPPLAEQLAIAHILGKLDDKIELNRQMSATLEAMARALFESWFVRFEPVRAKAEGRDTGLPKEIAELFPDSFEMSENGEVPKGWAGSYGHIATERSERVGAADVTVMSAIASSELVPSDDHFTKRVYSKDVAKYKRVHPWDFAYNPSRINIGSVGLHTGHFAGAVSPVYVVVTPRAGWHWFLKHHLKLAQSQERIMTLSSGSVRQSLDCSSFMSIPCPRPSDTVIEAFNAMTGSYRSRLASVVDESKTLTVLRDILLPKLISGDLRVPGAERFLEDAGVS